MLCADLVEVEWRDSRGILQRQTANLEDISTNGACIQLEQPVDVGATLRIIHPRKTLVGEVRYCVYRDIGYFLGVELDPSTKWSPKMFKPMHMLDPRRLMDRVFERMDAQP
jgi:hypothetical protein